MAEEIASDAAPSNPVRPIVRPAVLPAAAMRRRVATPQRLRSASQQKPDVLPVAMAARAAAPSPIFPIGFWFQPKSSFGTWQGRGCNYALGYEPESNGDGSPGVPLADYVRAAESLGLGTVRDPSDSTLNDSLWWGIVLQDEPDAGDASMVIPQLQKKIADFRQQAPGVPIILNLSGGRLLGLQSGPSDYSPFFALDVNAFGADMYPVTGWGRREPEWLKKVGDCVRIIKAKAPGKKALAFIESSDQRLPWVPAGSIATPSEVRAMIWHAIIAGADMLCVFSDIIGSGWLGFDGTPPPIACELSRQFTQIQYLANVLNAPGAEVASPAPFLACNRTMPDGTIFTFYLNNSNAPAVHPSTGVHFEAYGTRYSRSDESSGGGGSLAGQVAAITSAVTQINAMSAAIADNASKIARTKFGIQTI